MVVVSRSPKYTIPIIIMPSLTRRDKHQIRWGLPFRSRFAIGEPERLETAMNTPLESFGQLRASATSSWYLPPNTVALLGSPDNGVNGAVAVVKSIR
jgi:hypothetical protein